jgi:hypothetical protein
MMHWIKRIARLLSLSSFFIIFLFGIDPADIFNANTALIAFAKGCVGALLFWLLGFIVADIIIKGLVTDVRTDENDTLEGGLLQRLHGVQASLSPDSIVSVGGMNREADKAEPAKAAKT